jgi:hypothetical protein
MTQRRRDLKNPRQESVWACRSAASGRSVPQAPYEFAEWAVNRAADETHGRSDSSPHRRDANGLDSGLLGGNGAWQRPRKSRSPSAVAQPLQGRSRRFEPCSAHHETSSTRRRCARSLVLAEPHVGVPPAAGTLAFDLRREGGRGGWRCGGRAVGQRGESDQQYGIGPTCHGVLPRRLVQCKARARSGAVRCPPGRGPGKVRAHGRATDLAGAARRDGVEQERPAYRSH